MAENVRPPVAIRIVRPYETEDALLENELDTIGKTSVVLIGAHSRPTGVILRFEVTLSSGATVLRGEGRVLAHKENAFRGQAGLTLRFTRLDPRSKAVVDRATAMRETRAQGDASTSSRPSRPPFPPSVPDAAIAEALTGATPSPAEARARSASEEEAIASASAQEEAVASARASAREKANATARANARRTGRPTALTPPPVPVAEEASATSVATTTLPTARGAPPARESETTAPAPTPVTSVPGLVAERRPEMQTTAPPATGPTISAPPLARASRAAARAAREAAAAERDAESAHLAPVAPGPTPTVDGTRESHATRASAAVLEAPSDRAELLTRLRERAAALPADRIQEILSQRR